MLGRLGVFIFVEMWDRFQLMAMIAVILGGISGRFQNRMKFCSAEYLAT